MTASPITREKANPATERPFQKAEANLPSNSIVMRVARSLWPLKTDIALSERTGASDRMCRYWLASKYKLSADDICALLRSEDGLQFLEAIMGDARPVWWKRFKTNIARAELRRQLKLSQQRLEQLEMDLDA